MKILVDTPIWSVVLRRRGADESAKAAVAALARNGAIALIGPIRQELLSGIREQPQFERLRGYLRAFPDLEILPEDYETAASFSNRCRARGIQGSGTDFLLCAVAARHEYPIFTLDADFARFARVLPIVLYGAG